MAARTRATSGRFVGLQIDGFDEFKETVKYGPANIRKAVKKVDRTWGAKAADIVRSRALSEGSTAAHVADSIRSKALQSGIQIRAGGDGYPEFWGAEFGGGNFAPPKAKSNRNGRPGYTNQFREWRGKGADAGYFVYPAVRERIVPAMAARYLDDVFDAIAATPEVSGGE